MKKSSVVIVLLLAAALIVSLCMNISQNKKLVSEQEEVAQLRNEKLALLSEQEECLTYKEQSLKKELMAKYLDSIMMIANKAEKGEAPTDREKIDFYERATFILENIKTIGVSEEEINLVYAFIDSAKKTIEISAAAQTNEAK